MGDSVAAQKSPVVMYRIPKYVIIDSVLLMPITT
jgi:hypothetical protein